jgi:lysophospholipase L1-like esterase
MRALAFFLLVGLVGAAASPARSADPCDVPPELVSASDALPVVARRLAAKAPIKIVAIGSASTKGVGLTSPQAAYPERLRQELARRLPGIPITVVNLGATRETAQQMAQRFKVEVIPEKPTLVIWQTGTVDAVRSVMVDDFGEAIAHGIDKLRAAGSDVVLMNLQYSWRMAMAMNDQPYNDVMATIGDAHNAPLFDRYSIMKYWIDNGRFDFDNALEAERPARADAAHACLGRLLADFILTAAGSASPNHVQR